jgi:hypothetical protein
MREDGEKFAAKWGFLGPRVSRDNPFVGKFSISDGPS